MATQAQIDAADRQRAQQEIAGGNQDVQIVNGQVMVWQPTNVPQDAYSYQNVDPLTGQPRDYDPNGPWWGPQDGPGQWVPASYASPNGQLGSVLGKMIAYTSGGEYALGALGGGGAAAAGMGGAGGGSVAPAAGLTGAGAGAGAAGAGAGAAGAGATGAGLAGGGAGAAGAGTAGTIAGYLPYINEGLGVVSNLRQARSQNQAAQNTNTLTMAQLQTQQQNARLNAVTADLNQREYLDNLYQQKAKQAVKGGYLQGVQDVNIASPAGVPRATITGGLRPSAITNKGEIGAALQRDALLQLLNPTQPGGDGSTAHLPGMTYLPAIPQLPALPPLQNPTGVDTALGYVDLGGTLASQLLAQYAQRQPPPQTPRITAPSTTGAMAGTRF